MAKAMRWVRKRLAAGLVRAAERLEGGARQRAILRGYLQGCGAEKPDDAQRLKALLGARDALEHHVAHAAVAYYGGKHPKHYLWTEHNRFLYDRVRPGDRVLDIGCGASTYTQWIAEKAASVVGVDILPERVEVSNQRNTKPNVSYEVMDVTRQLPAERFDLAICSHVLEHLDDPVDFLRALAAGVPRLLVKVPLDDHDWVKLVKRDLGLFWMDDHDHRREYSEAMLRQQLKAAGWRVVEMIRGYDLRAEAVSGDQQLCLGTPLASG